MQDQRPPFSIEPLAQQDLPAALAIQSQAYPAFLVEPAQAFASRISVRPSYCLAAKCGETVLGYLLAHGWPSRSPPSVGTILPPQAPSEVLFVHDLAVSSQGRSLGVGHSLTTRAFELAARDGLRRAELIAVEGAADYWRRLGFIEDSVTKDLEAKLATYGPDARWMVREL